MKVLVGFSAGVLAGAVAAVLLTPESGEKMRGRLSAEACAKWQAAQGQLKKGVDGVQNQMTDAQGQGQVMVAGEENEMTADG